MRESWETMLREAEPSVEPREEYVERLSSELGSVVRNTRPRRSRRTVGLGAAAAVALLVTIGALAFESNDSPVASSPTATPDVETSLPLASAGADMPLSMERACDTFLVAVASFLGPGNVQEIAVSDSFAGSGPSAPSLYALRDQLKGISDLHELHGKGGPLSGYGFSEAISELGEAALFVQLGEFVQAERHLTKTRSLIADLADEPGLAGCLELGV